MKAAIATLLTTAILARADVISTSEPPYPQITAAAASVKPATPVSDVKGLAFNRFFQVWLENTDYNNSAANSDMQWLASQGILLTNYYAVTHPSEPNYCAAAGGDTFGMDNDNFKQIPANVSTVVDLLDTKGISWAEYQEAIPYPGFQGYNYSNQVTYADDYVRKHNPLILYDSIAGNETRARHIVGLDAFMSDLNNKMLPQWAFVTPNMTNDGHDTSLGFAAKWERNWMTTLMKNEYFMKDTLVLLTFDEEDSYGKSNKVYSILVGGAIPDNLKGTQDDTFYTHYSTIATASANWGLPSLGRWDCGANIFEIVANKTGYVNYQVDTTNLLLNETYPGPMAIGDYAKFSPVWPVPLTQGQCSAGHGILDSVKTMYGGSPATYNYTSPYPWDSKAGYNTKVTATRKMSTSTNSTSTASGSASGSASASATPGAAIAAAVPGSTIMTGALAALVAFLV